MSLPSYPLVLQRVSNTEDTPALVFSTNANSGEIEDYINAIKDVVSSIINNPAAGLNEAQVRAVIASTRIRRLIDGSRHQVVGTQTYNSGLPNEYTITYSLTTDGKNQYVINNTYTTESSFISCKDSDGSIEFPFVQCTGNNIIVVFTNKLSINTQKFITIF